MKKLVILMLAAMAVSMAMSSCKTTEENYRKAYDKVMEKDRQGIDSTIYAAIRNEAKPQEVTIGDQTVRYRSEYVSLTGKANDAGARLARYNVVAGAYKQLFTATSLQKRLREAGYEGTYVVETREPLYYVVPLSSDNLQEAVEQRDDFSHASPIRLVDPFPWILEAVGK